jgi:hypothetical protein
MTSPDSHDVRQLRIAVDRYAELVEQEKKIQQEMESLKEQIHSLAIHKVKIVAPVISNSMLHHFVCGDKVVALSLGRFNSFLSRYDLNVHVYPHLPYPELTAV